jgi:hypothetical protein
MRNASQFGDSIRGFLADLFEMILAFLEELLGGLIGHLRPEEPEE